MANEIDIVTIGTQKLADVVADFNKDLQQNATELVKAKAQLANYNKEVKETEKELEQLNTDLSTDTELIKQKQKALNDLIGKQQLATGEVKFWTKEVREATVDSIQYQKVLNEEAGSLDSLKAQLKVVTIAWEKMNGVERKNTVHGKALTSQKLALTQQLKVLEQSTGDYRRNVGNYTNSILGAFQGTGMLNTGMGNLGASFMSGQQILMLYTEMQEKFRTSAGGAAGGVSKISTALKFLKTALISSGIGAVVALLGTLFSATSKAEDGFKKLGEEADRGFWGKVWGNMEEKTNNILDVFNNISEVPIWQTFVDLGAAMISVSNSVQPTIDSLQELYNSLQSIGKDAQIKWAEQITELNSYKKAINDTTLSTEQRKTAGENLYKLEKEKLQEAIILKGYEIKLMERYYFLVSDPKTLQTIKELKLAYTNLNNDLTAKEIEKVENIKKIEEGAEKKRLEFLQKEKENRKIIRDNETALIKEEYERKKKELFNQARDEVNAISKATASGIKARESIMEKYWADIDVLNKEKQDKEKKRLQDIEIEKTEIELQGLEQGTTAYLEKQNEMNALKMEQELANTELIEGEKANIEAKYAQIKQENIDNFNKIQFDNELKKIEDKKNTDVSEYEYEREKYNAKLALYQNALIQQQITDAQYNELKKKADDDFAKTEINRAKAVTDLKKQLQADAVSSVIGLLDAFDKTGKASALAQIAYDTATAIASAVSSSSANKLNSVTFGGAGAIQFGIMMAQIGINIKKAYDIINTKSAKNVSSSGGGGGGGGGSQGVPYSAGFAMPQNVVNNAVNDTNQNLAISGLDKSIQNMNIQVAVTDIQGGLTQAKVTQDRITF